MGGGVRSLGATIERQLPHEGQQDPLFRGERRALKLRVDQGNKPCAGNDVLVLPNRVQKRLIASCGIDGGQRLSDLFIRCIVTWRDAGPASLHEVLADRSPWWTGGKDGVGQSVSRH